MEITRKQLESLLNQQKTLCWQQIDKAWKNSDYEKKLEELDSNGELKLKFYEIRDSIHSVEFPNEFEVIKKYSL